jgi:hypothetical protein
MIPFSVIVLDELRHCAPDMSLAEWHDSIQTSEAKGSSTPQSMHVENRGFMCQIRQRIVIRMRHIRLASVGPSSGSSAARRLVCLMPTPTPTRQASCARGQIGAPGLCCVILVVLCVGALAGPHASGLAQSNPEYAAFPLDPPTLADAQSLFYSGRYEAAAALTLALRAQGAADLASDELRSSALLFQLKELLEGRDKEDALKDCATCPDLIAMFLADVHHGQNLARTMLRSAPADEAALFFLGKLDLNYVWLQLGPLRRKTGWSEYWEARRSLDAVLNQNPQHVRARVARAWIDYIVDTKMPWGTRWLLGGGNRKQALADLREAADMESDFFTHAEAEFGLWDMYVRERDIARATAVARRLAQDFPDNRRLAAFLENPAAHSER